MTGKALASRTGQSSSRLRSTIIFAAQMDLPGGADRARQLDVRSLSSRVARRWIVLILVLVGAALLFLEHPPSDRLRDMRDSSSKYLQSQLRPIMPFQAASSSTGSFHRPVGPSNRTAKPRAAFVSLVRERQLDGILNAMRDIQWAFNDDPANGYDYIFLSEEPGFTDYFKNAINRFLLDAPSQPKAQFGVVSKEDWDIPAHIDLAKAKMRWTEMGKGRVPYGGSKTYRQMCRFYSGPVFHHPLLRDLDYTWRIEPETKHLCKYVPHWSSDAKGNLQWVERDPFRYMKQTGKKYAWIITMLEYSVTVRSLMVHINWWRRDNPSLVAPDNLLSFISDDGKGYNNCHFWTNFEIVDLSFVRSEAYTSLFNTLDKAGGFFYERWGDAPIRSIAASLLLNKNQVWHIDYAGYHHPPYTTCPRQQDPGSQCACDPQVSVDFDFSHISCTAKWETANGRNATEIVMQINEENGMGDFRWKPDEEPYAPPPPRLANTVY